MTIENMITDLTEQRDRLNTAIAALKAVSGLPADPKRVVAHGAPLVARKQSLACKNAVHGCTKEFTSPIWRERHEEDCTYLVKPNGSAAMARHTQ